MPADHKGTPIELIEAYLADTPFKDFFLSKVPFSISQETHFSGHWIVAPPGRGKSTLLHTMFLEDIKRNASIILMDSKGDLINQLKN
jgi:ABC-type cobalamin/Fe3+-siderophores transport system ATPase subunit